MAEAPVYDQVTGRRTDASWASFPDPLRGDGLDAWLEAAEITPVSAAEWRLASSHTIARRVLSTANWSLTHRGRATLRCDDRVIDVRPGVLVLIPPGMPHAQRQDPRDPIHGTSGHFHAHVLGGIDLMALAGFPRRIALGRDELPVVTGLVRQLAREYARREPGWRAAMAALLRTLLTHVLRHHGSAFTRPPAELRLRDGHRLLPALSVVERRLGDPSLAVDDLARAVGVSAVRLRTLFARVTGRSPAAFVRGRRLERACRLLRDGDDRVDAIAERVGFASDSFFSRAFRTAYGVSPGRWREQVDAAP